ncbi:MAG: hypothetical protein ABJG88_11495 [Litorimonas sp.]
MLEDKTEALANFDANAERLKSALSDWYDEEIEAIDAGIDEGVPQGDAGTISSVGPAIDSKRVLDASAVTKEIIGIDVPPVIIRKGGYDDLDDLISHLVPRLRRVISGDIKLPKKKKKKMAKVSS